VLIAVIVGVMVLIAGGGIVAFMLLSGDKKPDVAQNDGPAGRPPRNDTDRLPMDPNNPGRRPPFGPNNPGGPNGPGGRPPFGPGGQPPFGPGGGRPGGMPPGGANNPLQNINFAELDVGNVPAKQASQLDALSYLPADSSIVFGVDAGDLLSVPAISALIQSAGAGNLGITPSQVDQIVAGINVPTSRLAAFSAGAMQDIAAVTVIKTKSPFDPAAVRQASNANEAQQLEGKTVYKGQLNGRTSYLYMPTNNIAIFTQLPEDEVAALIKLPGDKPVLSEEITATLGKVGQAHAWAVMSGELLKNASKSGGGSDQQKALNESLAKANGASFALRMQGKQIKLTSAVYCEDAETSKKLAGGMQLLWNLMAKGALEGTKTKVPALADLITDVQNVQFKNQGETALLALDINFASIEPLKKMSQMDWMTLAMSMSSMAQQGGGLAQGPSPGDKPGGDKPGDDKPGADKPGDSKPGSAAPADDGTPEGLEEGQRAPEILGTDTDGKEFKLSEYRGKVVLLDFWGHW
jgi:hypothetical protein